MQRHAAHSWAGGHPTAGGLESLYLREVGTAEEVARHLLVSPSTVRRLIRDGRLVGRKVGRRWYVTRRSLLAFLESGDASPRRSPLALVRDEDGGAL